MDCEFVAGWSILQTLGEGAYGEWVVSSLKIENSFFLIIFVFSINSFDCSGLFIGLDSFLSMF